MSGEAEGLGTGAKAVVNGAATAAVNIATLGTHDGPVEPWAVNDIDRAYSYNTAAGFAQTGFTILAGAATGGLQSALSKGGTLARAAGTGLNAFDTLSNGVGLGQGAQNIQQNGLSLNNALQVAGSGLGLVGNLKGALSTNASPDFATANSRLNILNNSCFAAGTPLLTPDGSKYIEDFQVGDLILARDESDPEGLVTACRVLNLFRNYSPLLDLRVGGHVIRTTAEHPFWVVGTGWVAAQQIQAGDLLVGANGEQTPVESIEGPIDSAPVYNLEVEEYHTYLVGSTLWGFSVWAHNSDDCLPGAAGQNLAANQVQISRSAYPETAQHIQDAQAAGQPSVLTIDRPGATANRAAALAGQERVPGMQLDEYPPAMFSEGGAGASVRPVSPSDNMGAGASMGNQLRKQPDGAMVQINVVE